MSEIAGNIVRIEDRGSFLGEDFMNVYHYFLAGGVPSVSLINLATQFFTNVITPLATLQNEALLHEELYLKMLNFGVLEYTTATALPGSRTAIEPLTSYQVASYKLARAVTDIKNGGKRISGLSEDDANGNVFSTAGFTRWDSGKGLFDLNLTTSDGVWEPIILGKESLTTPGLFNISSITDVVLNNKIRTQKSREA